MNSALPNLLQSVRRLAQAAGERCAIEFEGAAISYRALDRAASRVGSRLATRLPPQSRVAWLDFNTPAFFELYLGALKARCTLVAVNARLAPPEVEYILCDAEARCLFVGAEHYALVEAIESRLPQDLEIVALDGGHGRWPAYADWRAAGAESDGLLVPPPDDDVIQLYTSGTTGHPKGVCHTHRTWGEAVRALQSIGWAAFEPDSVCLASLPLFHVAGFNPACIALLTGGRVVLQRKVEPMAMLEALAKRDVTVTLLVPAALLALVTAARGRSLGFPKLRCITYGASPIAPDLLREARELFTCDFQHMYGLTENWGVGTCLVPAMHDPKLGKLESCGLPYAGCELRVIDAQGRDAAVGEVGEIVMRSPWVMREYWRQPQATAATVRDGWLWSGDAGCRDADGYVYIRDRVKDMIKSGGENVYPAEVENALYGHPAVADVAVIGIPDERWGEAVTAVVVLRPGASFDEADLLAHARARIGGYKVPKSVRVVAELPRNASGKILRRVLREQFWQGRRHRVN